MRDWSAVAPFNFAHAIRLRECADLDRWQLAAEDVVEALSGTAVRVRIETVPVDIEAHLSAEMNRPFDETDLPLRFFVVEAGDGGHWFGVVIDHWLADDFSCRALLAQMYSTYATGRATRAAALRRLVTKPRRTRWWVEWRNFLHAAAIYRRAVRIPLRDPLDFSSETFRTELPAEALPALRSFARENGATVHDVFLAAAARAFGSLCAIRPGSRRNAVALVSAVDLRRFETGESRSDFGVQLSQYAVVVRQPHTRCATDVLKRIAVQTQRLKGRHGSELFRVTQLFWRLARSPRAKATLFHRGAPAAAGLSDVNLTGEWMERPEVTEYRRVASAGVLVPMVLMITTFKGGLFIDTTYRTAAFTRSAAENAVADIAAHLMD